MRSFIVKPNLPEGKVTGLICGTDDEAILDFFIKNKISVFKNAANTDIDPSVAAHADMAVLHLGGNRIIADARQDELICELKKNGLETLKTADRIKGEYPYDIKLNFALIGNSAAGFFKYCDDTLNAELGSRRMINVKQGYSKCSALVIDEHSVITDDPSIHKALEKNGFDALLISKGDISLQGHGYGFIGGASGKISKDTVLFFGDITAHRDFDKINTFLISHGCHFICTDKGQLRDIGGIIPIFEEKY